MEDVVRPRLDAAGADCTKVIAPKGICVFDDNGKLIDENVHFDLDKHITALSLVIEQTPNVRLIIIDPLSAFMGKIDSHKNTEVRGVLSKLAGVAEHYNVAIVCVSHFNKPSKTTSANYRIIGSIAFNAAARAVWYIIKDPTTEEGRLFLPGKHNLTTEQYGLKFRLESVPEDSETGQLKSVRCVFGETDERTIDEMLTATENKNYKSPKRTEAKLWLQDVLERGPVAADEIKELATINHITESTLQRAKTDVGVTTELSGIGDERKSMWKLPE
ncbi:hypothetical protein ES708_14304 [subsurface metagenome]